MRLDDLLAKYASPDLNRVVVGGVWADAYVGYRHTYELLGLAGDFDTLRKEYAISAAEQYIIEHYGVAKEEER